jgi:hypothetical protein
MGKGLLLFGKTRSQVFNETYDHAVCCYCNRKIYAPYSLILDADKSKAFCSWECFAQSHDAKEAQFDENNQDYTKFFYKKGEV